MEARQEASRQSAPFAWPGFVGRLLDVDLGVGVSVFDAGAVTGGWRAAAGDGDDHGVVGVAVGVKDDCALAAGDDSRGRDRVRNCEAFQPHR